MGLNREEKGERSKEGQGGREVLLTTFSISYETYLLSLHGYILQLKKIGNEIITINLLFHIFVFKVVPKYAIQEFL